MYILSKHLDWLLAGGLSIILYTFVYFLKLDLLRNWNIAQIAFLLAFVVNNPHFISSYFFFYSDERDRMMTSHIHQFVGIFFPIILAGVMFAGLFLQSTLVFTVIINALYFFVGLHYVRQVYGISLISLAKRKIFLTSKQKWALNLSMYPLWFVSFLNGHRTDFIGHFYNIPYTSYTLPLQLITINNVLFATSLLLWVYLLIQIYTFHKAVPLTMIAALFSLVLWHFPFFYNSGFFYVIPLFHSLQYMLIVAAVKKNTVSLRTTNNEKFFYLAGYVISIFLLAYLTFHLVPEMLDKNILYSRKLFGGTAIVGIFLLFINLHHYAMDALLWRRGSRLTKYV